VGASSIRRPSALRHGLSSQYAREQWSGAVVALAEALVGSGRREPGVVEAAREEAEAILYLRRVRQCRLLALEESTLRRCTPTEESRAIALRLREAVKRDDAAACDALREELRGPHDAAWLLDIETTSTIVLGLEFGECAAELRRLNDYERRAISSHRKTLRRLDYEQVEAERRRVADAKHQRPGGGRDAA
jgi:hypothetical protein